MIAYPSDDEIDSVSELCWHAADGGPRR